MAYQCLSETMISQVMIDYNVEFDGAVLTLNDIDNYAKDLTDCMLEASSQVVPMIKRSGNAKPYWHSSLSQLSKCERQARRHWVADGRPRNLDHPSRIRYKEAKRTFRATQRKLEYEYELKSMWDISQSCTIDQKFFWYLVNKRNGKKRSVIFQPTIDEISNKKLYDENDIITSWGQYYENLLTPNDNDHYDETHMNTIRDDVNTLLAQAITDDSSIRAISADEIKSVTCKMKRGKAAGADTFTMNM